MHEVGFEPTKHLAPDLKSGPFDRSGTHADVHCGTWTHDHKIKSLALYQLS